MAKDEEKAKPKVKTIEIELLHPISHEKGLFSRGIHKLDEETAKLFLSLKGAVDKKPIARIPQVVEAPKGIVEVPKDTVKKEKK